MSAGGEDIRAPESLRSISISQWAKRSYLTGLAAFEDVRHDYDLQCRRPAGRSRPPGALRRPPVDPFRQMAKLRRRDRHRAVGRLWPDEAPSLQPLRMSLWPPASHTRTPLGIGIIAA